MEKKTKRSFNSEQRAVILKKHFQEKVPVSQVCVEFAIQPSQFYDWQNQLFTRMNLALDKGKPRVNSNENKLEEKVRSLEAKLAKKDSVIAEISQEYVELKKELGEP